MKLGFVTCVQLGLDCIEEILAANASLDVVMTLHDDIAPQKSGRVFLDEMCSQHEIPLCKVRNINDADAIEQLRAHDLDWLFIIGWSQIAHDQVLDLPARGCVGIHPTLLPKGRGRASIPWAIIKGVATTGVTMFKLDGGVDTGPIISQVEIDIASDEDAATLYSKVCAAHRVVMRKFLSDLRADTVAFRSQNHAEATVWPGRKPVDGQLNQSMTCAEVDRLVRGTTRPYPGAYLMIDERKLIVWRGTGAPGALGSTVQTKTLEFADGAYLATDWEWA